MFLIGAAVNMAVVVVAGLLGSLLKKGIFEQAAESVTKAVGVCVLVIGIRGAIRSVAENATVDGYIEIIAVVCMAVGMLIGEWLRLDAWMNRLGEWVQKKASGGKGDGVGGAFVAASMIFCIGAWAITGAFSAAQGDHTSLIAKSVVDGITALMLASSLGWGVCLAGVSLFVWEGLLSTVAYFLGAFLPAAALSAMSIVGSIVIMMVAMNLIGLTKIRVANAIPAVFLPILAVLILS